MNLVVSDVEFAVLTVLIRVGVNDSAPSLGTHYRGWMGDDQREEDGVCKVEKWQKCSPQCNIFSPLFWLTLNPSLFLSTFSIFTNHFCFPPTHTHLNLFWCWERMSWSPAWCELVDREASSGGGNVWNEHRLHVYTYTRVFTDSGDTDLKIHCLQLNVRSRGFIL